MPSESSKRSSIQRIEDILDNIERIRRFTDGCDAQAFLSDDLTRYAVTRAIEIISEASRHLPDEMKSRLSSIDWRGMAAAGNVYRHGYDVVDETYVWDVVTRDLEPLHAAMILELRTLGIERKEYSS